MNPTLDERLAQLASDMIANRIPLREAKDRFERVYWRTGLRFAEGSRTRAAAILGTHRNTIIGKLRAERRLERGERNG